MRRSDVDHFGAERDGGGALDGRRIGGHDDDGFCTDRARRVGDALGVVAAGVGDDAAADLFGRELEDLVGRAANFECADGLQAFGLEPDFSFGGRPGNGARMSGVLRAMPAMRAAAERIAVSSTNSEINLAA